MALAQHPSPEMSYLQVYDLETRQASVIAEFPFTVEAPNWSPDGEYLLVNVGGKLFRISPDGASGLEPVDTGSIAACNNDHVISADGKFIGLSSNDPSQPGYNSYVYVVPAEGGEPRKVTPIGPSYLHGISPDGKMLAYCAFRGPQQDADVWVMPVNGGRERRLTTAPGLDDGPEYSPDGRHIWFNSVRTGRMQVWRMNANGARQTQMTFDADMNSWFPHISPDGEKVVYIAYHDYEIDPGSHVANLNVQLRMIPAKGGEPEVLLEMFGGQGSLNVNSWSPDSRKFAFVSYRLKEEIEAPAKDMSVQLYSLRDLIGSPSLFAKNHKYVLERLSQMGFSGVEAANYDNGLLYGLEPREFRGVIEKAGLKLVSSHVNFSSSIEWWDRCIEAHKQAGVEYLVLAWSDPLNTREQMQEMAQFLQTIGEKCKAQGIKFGYHSHSHEFVQVDGTTMMDEFICGTGADCVFFEMDVYWAVKAGVSPVDYMNKYPGRYELLHIKDHREIGLSGMVDFDAIFRNFGVAGTKGFVVELEEASSPNILKGLRESALYIRNNL